MQARREGLFYAQTKPGTHPNGSLRRESTLNLRLPSSSRYLLPSMRKRGFIEKALAPLRELPGITAQVFSLLPESSEASSLARFTFVGPNSADAIRLGIFAGI